MRMSCPSEEDLAALLEGDLDAVERKALELHVKGCGECRLLWRRLGSSDVLSVGDNSTTSPQEIAELNARASASPSELAVDKALGAHDIVLSRDATTLAVALVPTVLERVRLVQDIDGAARLAPSQRPTLPIGLVLADRYRLLRFIGRGGMGQVYEAEDLELHKRVAVKAINDELAANPEMISRLKREVQLAHQVTHPNVCRIFDFGQQRSSGSGPSLAFITMELLSGETLAQRVQRGPLAAQEALPIVRQLAGALAAAHCAGVIHRDFKSDNIILLNAPDGVRAVITDFGLARAAFDGDFQISSTGAVLGTVYYMAPEQALGEQVTRAADIYALGVVMFEMLTGQLPFTGKSPLAVALNRMHREPPSARALRPEISPALEAVILKCLALSPSERFHDAQEIAAALSIERPETGKRMHLQAALGAAAAVSLCAASIVTTSPHRRAGDLPPSALTQSTVDSVKPTRLPAESPPAVSLPPRVTVPPSRGNLVLHVEPLSARARLDGSEVTLLRGTARFEVEAGERHALIVSAPKYRTWRQSLAVEPGRTTERRIALSRIYLDPQLSSSSNRSHEDDDAVDPYADSVPVK
jgi:serine/threonine protein kinase